jgi:3-methyl-2-oxobutanoate hydroxymethyltransferase
MNAGEHVTAPGLVEMKLEGRKIVALTAYDYLFASLLDRAGIDVVLVGDSAAMVSAGRETTLPLTMPEAIYHCRMARRGVQRALLVADMPFLSFQVSTQRAVYNAGRFFKQAEVDAVKVEGGRGITPAVRAIVEAGMPVMGHLGLTPQAIKRFGSYSVQARDSSEADELLQDALALQEAGVFAVVLEKIPAALAGRVSRELKVPTIGIGAGPQCDGQILVTYDLLGLFTEFKPKFVRRYAKLAEEVSTACAAYAQDVRQGRYPSGDESF